MMQNVLKNLQELHGHIDQLPVDQQAILTTNVDQLSASLAELAAEFEFVLLSKQTKIKLEKLNHNLGTIIAEQSAKIRYLEQQLEQSQMLYKRVTQALTKGEARLQTLQRNSSDLMTILQADGRIRDENAIVAERMFGYHSEQRIGKLPDDLIHPDDVPVWQAYLAKLLKQPGIAPPVEYRKLHASGYWVYLEVMGNNLLHDSSINGIVINSRDITDRKVSATALEKSQQQIVNILEKITDGFFTLNSNWQFTYVNQKAEQCWQRERQELIGKKIWHEFPEIAKTSFFKQFHKSVFEKANLKFESYYPPLNSWFEVETYPSDEGLSVFFQNITDRKNAENALRASESRYRILSQITSDFAYSFKVLPDNTWVCEWMTEAFTNITGYTPKEIATSGSLQFECIHPDDVEMLLEQMQLRSSSRKEVSEYRIITKSGEIRWLWDCRQVVWDEVENRAIGIYGACQDITQHKLVQAKLCETNQVLQGLIKALPLAVVGIDTNALVTIWNEAAERVFGWKESEVVGKILPIVPSDKNVDFYTMFHSELAGEPQVAKKCQRRRKEGSSIDVCIWTSPIRDAEGLISGTIKIFSEISKAKEKQKNIDVLPSRRDALEPFWARYVHIPEIMKKN
ncbi:PAS domain S-box protein [Tychonema sp. BBK16]|uniref:PAS domain S-box protein n=1 Tax=Tychonema sp. BBK16 TaxID=2699888 RepID=UPI001F379B21|nr:PAS domain S-box protein [Tychonema sp. BBK16]MCF6375108.1 PAS domain S-box protein [Tychonema sp. BBK16]